MRIGPRFPWSYPWRSLLVRWPASLFSAVGIAMTVAVLCGVFALRAGFQSLLTTTGSERVAVYLRPGAQSEGESGIDLEQVRKIRNQRPEVARDADGKPLAAGESYLALFLARRGSAGAASLLAIQLTRPPSDARKSRWFRRLRVKRHLMHGQGAWSQILRGEVPSRSDIRALCCVRMADVAVPRELFPAILERV